MLLVNRLKDGFTSGITSSLSDSTPSRDYRGVSKGSVSISCLFGLHQWRFDNASHLEKSNTVRMDASPLPTAFLTSTGEFIGEDTNQTSQHDISENNLKRNENTRQGIVL